MKLSLYLTSVQIREVHELYQRHCFYQDFIERCNERLQDKTGLCNLPYDTLSEEDSLLDFAYILYCKWKDCNVTYNTTLDSVIDEVESLLNWTNSYSG